MVEIQKRQTEKQILPYGVGDSRRVYAIGDVHGCAHLLQSLLCQITENWRAAHEERPDLKGTLLYLGDLIDRGPDSRRVLEIILAGPPAGLSQIVLKGNHELLMLDFMQGDHEGGESTWLLNGGIQTAQSYGVALSGQPHEMQHDLKRRVPRRHIELLKKIPAIYQLGQVVFVHAGINPYINLTQQNPDDLLWIREPFLSSNHDFGCYIVHGHTPCNGLDIHHNRANVDTGAVYGGWLSAAVIDDHQMYFLQVSDGQVHVNHRSLGASC